MYQPMKRLRRDVDPDDVRVMCDNCGVWDHAVDECPLPVHCMACGEDGHTLRTCPEHPLDPSTQGGGEAPRTLYGNREDEKGAMRFIVLPARIRDLKRKTRASGVYVGKFDAEGKLETAPEEEAIEPDDQPLTCSHHYVIEIMEGLSPALLHP